MAVCQMLVARLDASYVDGVHLRRFLERHRCDHCVQQWIGVSKSVLS
jgi:hypothetical protein